MLTQIAHALVPVFFVLGLGYGAGRHGSVDNTHIASLNTLLVDFVLPASLLASIARRPRDELLHHAPLAIAVTVSLLGVYAATLLIQRTGLAQPLGTAAVRTLTYSFPNFAAIGLPLATSVFGPAASISVAIVIAVGLLTVSPATLVLLEQATTTGPARSSGRNYVHAMRTTMQRPIVWAPVLGSVCSLAGIPLPELVDLSLQEIGTAAAGVGLFLTGLVLSAQTIHLDRNVLAGVLTQNMLQPALTMGVVLLLGMPANLARQTVLLMAIPAGFFGILYGARHHIHDSTAGSTLLISSLASVITLPITLWLIKNILPS